MKYTDIITSWRIIYNMPNTDAYISDFLKEPPIDLSYKEMQLASGKFLLIR
jgi:hypothetical protein